MAHQLRVRLGDHFEESDFVRINTDEVCPLKDKAMDNMAMVR